MYFASLMKIIFLSYIFSVVLTFYMLHNERSSSYQKQNVDYSFFAIFAFASSEETYPQISNLVDKY